MRSCFSVAAVFTTLVALSATTSADTVPTAADQLAAAQKAGRPTYLLVTEPRARGLEDMRLSRRGSPRWRRSPMSSSTARRR